MIFLNDFLWVTLNKRFSLTTFCTFFTTLSWTVFRSGLFNTFKRIQTKLKENRNKYKYTGQRLESQLLEEIDRLIKGKDEQPNYCYKYIPQNTALNKESFKNALKRCLRILIVINCGENFVPEFVYLDGAEVLRKWKIF